MWKRLDNFVQNWYTSLTYPLGDVVMGTIGLAIGTVLVGGILY